MEVRLDHIIWAVPERADGMALFEEMSGVAPALGGSHPGFGSCNALASLSDRLYLEILAPDREQDLSGTWGADVAALKRPTLFSFSLECSDLEGMSERLRGKGVAHSAPISMSRSLPDGSRLEWRIMRLAEEGWSSRLPFFIDWQGAPHPGGATPAGCSLAELTVYDRQPDRLRRIFDAMSCDVPVLGASNFGMMARLETPRGPLLLT